MWHIEVLMKTLVYRIKQRLSLDLVIKKLPELKGYNKLPPVHVIRPNPFIWQYLWPFFGGKPWRLTLLSISMATRPLAAATVQADVVFNHPKSCIFNSSLMGGNCRKIIMLWALRGCAGGLAVLVISTVWGQGFLYKVDFRVKIRFLDIFQELARQWSISNYMLFLAPSSSLTYGIQYNKFAEIWRVFNYSQIPINLCLQCIRAYFWKFLIFEMKLR